MFCAFFSLNCITIKLTYKSDYFTILKVAAKTANFYFVFSLVVVAVFILVSVSLPKLYTPRFIVFSSVLSLLLHTIQITTQLLFIIILIVQCVITTITPNPYVHHYIHHKNNNNNNKSIETHKVCCLC